MFCSACGKELRINAAFCAYCGQPVNNGNISNSRNINTHQALQAKENSPAESSPHAQQAHYNPSQQAEKLQNLQIQQPVQLSSNGVPIINASADAVYRYGHDEQPKTTSSTYTGASAQNQPSFTSSQTQTASTQAPSSMSASSTAAQSGEVYFQTETLTQAANIAVLRATQWRRAYEGEEDYEADQFYPDFNIKKLLKVAEKEDASHAKHNVNISYIVSPEGAIGAIVDEDDGTTPECDIYWQFYTEKKVLKYLPKWQRDIKIQQS